MLAYWFHGNLDAIQLMWWWGLLVRDNCCSFLLEYLRSRYCFTDQLKEACLLILWRFGCHSAHALTRPSGMWQWCFSVGQELIVFFYWVTTVQRPTAYLFRSDLVATQLWHMISAIPILWHRHHCPICSNLVTTWLWPMISAIPIFCHHCPMLSVVVKVCVWLLQV